MFDIFNLFAEQYGPLVALLAGLVTICSIFASIPRLYKFLYTETIENRKKWRETELVRILDNQLSKNEEDDVNVLDIIKSKYFIPTKAQDTNPDEDLSECSKNFYLIDYFLTHYFIRKSPQGKRRFFILGGSGMGKSTFSAALVYHYLQKYNKRTVPFKIEMLTLGHDFCDKIRNMQEPAKTILILDGLDENINAVNDKEKFIYDLEKLTNNFKYIILTCRTQFFDNKDEELKNVTIPQPSINKCLAYKNFYISPFNDDDIKAYLGQKYNIPSEKYSLALSIVEKSKSLMSRPLVLFYIDDILALAKQETLSAFEIYKKIIDNWFNRECDILGIYNREERTNTVNTLYELSKKISRCIYQEWKNTGSFSLSDEKYNKFIDDYKQYSNIKFSFKKRSLLSRDNMGFVKFSHKSFLEFFLAIDAVENPGIVYNAEGLEMSKKFYQEIYSLYINKRHFANLNYKAIRTKPSNYAELKKMLINAQNKISSTEDIKILKQTYSYTINLLWDEFTQNYIKTTLDAFKVSHASLPSVYEIGLDAIQYTIDCLEIVIKINNNVNDLIDSIQKGFKIIDDIREYGWLKYFVEQIDEINAELIALNHKIPLKSIFNCEKSNLIIPLSSQYIISAKNDMLLINNFMYLNCSFSSDEDIHSFINLVLKEKPGINFVGLLKNFNNISELLEFILQTSESIKNSDAKIGNNCIVIFSEIGNRNLKYVINDKTLKNNKSEITTILNGMSEASKYYNNYEQETNI